MHGQPPIVIEPYDPAWPAMFEAEAALIAPLLAPWAVGGIEHTEFFLQLDKPTQAKLMAAKLQAEADVHRALADGHAKLAEALK